MRLSSYDLVGKYCKLTTAVLCRYLTKITDHIVCLISEEHGKKLVLDVGGDDDDDMDIDKDDDGDRMFAFEVSKTNEQDENVVLYKGFDVSLARMCSLV